MRILVIDGSPFEEPFYNNVYRAIENSFSKNSLVSRVKLSNNTIKYCKGCFDCWLKTPGECVIKDDSQKILKQMINSNILILLTPVVFGGYSYLTKELLDKSIPLVSPLFTLINGEMHHKKRYKKYPSLIGLGVMENFDEEESENFKNLIFRNSVNLHNFIECAEILLKEDTYFIIKGKIAVLLKKMEVN